MGRTLAALAAFTTLSACQFGDGDNNEEWVGGFCIDDSTIDRVGAYCADPARHGKSCRDCRMLAPGAFFMEVDPVSAPGMSCFVAGAQVLSAAYAGDNASFCEQRTNRIQSTHYKAHSESRGCRADFHCALADQLAQLPDCRHSGISPGKYVWQFELTPGNIQRISFDTALVLPTPSNPNPTQPVFLDRQPDEACASQLDATESDYSESRTSALYFDARGCAVPADGITHGEFVVSRCDPTPIITGVYTNADGSQGTVMTRLTRVDP